MSKTTDGETKTILKKLAILILVSAARGRAALPCARGAARGRAKCVCVHVRMLCVRLRAQPPPQSGSVRVSRPPLCGP